MSTTACYRPNAGSTNRLHAGRRLSQILFFALILLLPVFDIFRYDVDTKDLFLFGQIWSLGLQPGFELDRSAGGAARVAIQFFLKGILPWVVVLSVFPLLGVLFGRVFCGWLCPEGALFEVADFLTEKILGRRSVFRAGSGPVQAPPARRWFWAASALACYLLLPPVIALGLAGYFVNPAILFERTVSLRFTTGMTATVIGVYLYVFMTSVFVRHGFCKYVCAPGLMQMMFGWISRRSLRVRFHRDEVSRCTECRKCEEVCYMGVRPRAPLRNINCVNCGECVEACRQELDGEGLFSYGFGDRRSAAELSRKAIPSKNRDCPAGTCRPVQP